MRNKKKISALMLVGCVAVFICGCKGNTGDQGQKGPQGNPGPQGPQGGPGPNCSDTLVTNLNITALGSGKIKISAHLSCGTDIVDNQSTENCQGFFGLSDFSAQQVAGVGSLYSQTNGVGSFTDNYAILNCTAGNTYSVYSGFGFLICSNATGRCCYPSDIEHLGTVCT